MNEISKPITPPTQPIASVQNTLPAPLTFQTELSAKPIAPVQPILPLSVQSLLLATPTVPVQMTATVQQSPPIQSCMLIQHTSIVQPQSPLIDTNLKTLEEPIPIAKSPQNEPIPMDISPIRPADLPPAIMPEMNTIPLDLDHLVSQQRKIREMRRRNSVADMISPHQRNILNKFANSLKQKKLKFEDIIKTICNSTKASSSSGSSSSSSDSDSSDSSESNSSSSSSSGSVRKSSRRHQKKKRSHKRHSESHKSSTSDSSSSSSSSSASSSKAKHHHHPRRKRARKSSRKSPKTSKTRSSSSSGHSRSAPKPIFDIEMIKKNALMGCALHEKMLRKKLNQISQHNLSTENLCSPPFVSPARAVSSNEINEMALDAANKLKVPYVKLQRSSIIDDMAETYAQEQNNMNIPTLTSIFKRKRSN